MQLPVSTRSVLLALALAATPLLLAASPFGRPVSRLWQSILWVGLVALVSAAGSRVGDFRLRPRPVAIGLGGGLLLFPATAAAHAVVGLATGRSAMPAPGTTEDGALPLLVVGMLAAAVVEEIAFRGVLQEALTARIGGRGALLATAVVFALYHGGPVQWPATLVLGLGFGWLAHRHGLAAALTAHLAYNAGGALLFLTAAG